MESKTTSLYDVSGESYVIALAAELKKNKDFAMPEWGNYVKTSMSKERPPQNDDWWQMRAASILRQLYLKGTIGVNRLSTRYGSKKARGMQPSKFFEGGRKIIRVILQQAEKSGLVEKIKEPKPGRKFTKKGKQFMDQVAASMKK
jgi:small subunit ribosomal protein S19e